jgi:hypothetical protein
VETLFGLEACNAIPISPVERGERRFKMLPSRASSAVRLASAAAAGLLLLSSASYAASYEQMFPGRGHSAPNAYYYAPGASYSSGGAYIGSTPQDFHSSHVCINGYRWITRDFERGWENPAENAVPVRC